MKKAYGILTIKSADEIDGKRIFKGIATTPKIDRAEDIVEPKGANFTLPIPFLWQHNHDEPAGDVIEVTVNDKSIEVTVEIKQTDEDGELKKFLDKVWQSIKIKLVKGLSIGFNPTKFEILEDSWGLHILEWDWLELSAVTIPCNPDAVITDIKTIKKAFGIQALPKVEKSEPPPTEPPKPPKTKTVKLLTPKLKLPIRLISNEEIL